MGISITYFFEKDDSLLSVSINLRGKNKLILWIEKEKEDVEENNEPRWLK